MKLARFLKMSGWYERTAAALVAAVFAMNVYRAVTQSITTDEAFAYNDFVAGPLSSLVNTYDACNHVLHTSACKLSTTLLGTSEFTLRLPSLLGGLFYLITALRLCRYLFGARTAFLLSFAALALNPFILDYLSAARGYGMALAFWTWAVFHIVRFASEHDAAWAEPPMHHLHKAALGLGLSVASNLVFLFPAAALGGLVFLHLAVDGLLSGDREILRRQLARAADHFAVPAVVAAFLIVVTPLSTVAREKFYFGVDTLRGTVSSIVDPTFFHDPIRAFERSRFQPGLLAATELFAVLLLVAAAAFLALLGYRWFRARAFWKLGLLEKFLFWSGGSMLLTLAGLLVAHHAFGLPYPRDRTGLYGPPLIVLTFFALLERGSRIPRAVGFVAAVLCLAVFAAQFQTACYYEWRHDTGTRSIVESMRAHHALHPKAKVRVGANWQCEPSLNFYRRIDRLDWMEPVNRKDPDGEYDYYVLLPEDRGLLQEHRLVTVYTDARSGALLAVPR